MESVELYRQLLGLSEPWTVERVDIDVAKGRVEVYVGHRPGQRFACPECGQELAVYDHLSERTWRHLDSMQFLTYLHARPPRVSCAQHGVKQVRLPWAQAGGRFTHLFEALGGHCSARHEREARRGDPAHHMGRGVAYHGARGAAWSSSQGTVDAQCAGG